MTMLFPPWNAAASKLHFTPALTKSTSASFEIAKDFSTELGFYVQLF